MQRANPATENQATMISPDSLARMLGVSIRTVYRYIEAGILPPPMRFSEKVMRWPRETIEEAFRHRIMKPHRAD